jgi:adenylate cyclase
MGWRMAVTDSPNQRARSWWHKPTSWWYGIWKRHPFIGMYLVIIWPNAVWSVANLVYNDKVIIGSFCDQHLETDPKVQAGPATPILGPQKRVFWNLAVPTYTVFTWTVGMAICAWLIWPLLTYFRAQQHAALTPAIKAAAEKRLINLPWYQLWCNSLLWLPGGFFFPAMICFLGDMHNAEIITIQFLASFFVSALITAFQTFVLLERFLLVYLYPAVFTDVKPSEVTGGIHLSFQVRLYFLWAAVCLGPIVVLSLIAFDLQEWEGDFVPLTIGVTIFGIATGAIIVGVVGRDLSTWLQAHIGATREIARENFDVRISELRSDEWGHLTDSFNTMAQNLSLGRQVHEVMGQFVGPEVRDEILKHYSKLGGNVQEITVLFADLRGFTRRSAGKAPEEVVDLLNRFLSLGEQAVDGNGGWVNKFLGDGFMARFGTPLPLADHADLALAAARDFVRRLDDFNCELEKLGQSPLKVGIGIHTGPALVGSIGATITTPTGGQRIHMELTAIGETVNLTQRLEEHTKNCAARVLFSESTHSRLKTHVAAQCLGPQEIRGASEPMVVYSLDCA